MLVLVASLAAAAGLLALHEYLAARVTVGRPRLFRVRQALLLLAVGATAVFGTRVQPFRAALLDAAPRHAVPFAATGDPLFSHALSDQAPDNPFPDGQAPADIEAWRSKVTEVLRTRTGFDTVFDTVPVETLSTEQIGSVRRTLIKFVSWDGTSIPAYVHQPVTGPIKGAVLVVAGHGNGIAATAGLVDEYQHSAAKALAEHGYITLTPEVRGFGMLAPNGVANHRFVAFAALEAGSFFKAVVVKDLSRAFTVLQAWPGVDPSHVAVAGTSLGGELAVFLGVLDPRPKVILSHSYGGATGAADVSDQGNDESQQTPHGCHSIPGINRIVREEDWFRLLAPRPVLVVRGSTNTPGSAKSFQDLVSRSYVPFGAADRFEFAVEQGGHEFYLQPALQFLQRWL